MCFVTVILIFDGEAEDVAGPEAGAVIYTSVEQRVGVGVLNVQNLTSGCNMAGYALISWNTKLLLHSEKHTIVYETFVLLNN